MTRYVNVGSVLGSFLLTLLLLGFVSPKQEKPVTMAEFSKRTGPGNPKITLVYFHANWCSICAKMKPMMDEIENEYKTKIDILNIDTDRDKEVAKEFDVDALPVLIIFKNGQRQWVYAGLIDKNTLKATIDTYQ